MGGNHTMVIWFCLLGLMERKELKGVLFVIFLLVHSVTVLGNLGVVILIRTSPQLHTPTYFFLSILSFLDFSYSTINTPRLLVSFLTSDRSISFAACVAQMAMMTLHGAAECLLLAIMAYDRFAAICHPLLYHAIMSQCLCTELVAMTYAAGAANTAAQTGNVSRLPYCGPNVIDHYFGDAPPVLHLACTPIYTLLTICRMHSLEAQRKAFSTCASHLIALSLFYGTITFMYAQPRSSKFSDQNKVVSVFYTTVIPMLNPLIYSLRNREVKTALRKKLQGDSREKLAYSFLGQCPLPDPVMGM
ncbi:olfactory receptor 5P3-like [Phascolarctos cinereus]|uniref:Olfactory receptor n=1 Tax=Phascolarctos cinereus TaxID=38626 RepID=A0A6P5J7K3_PHACI|nr:olfactory receptor 5P3-like [Phascolarctos cinereus]